MRAALGATGVGIGALAAGGLLVAAPISGEIHAARADGDGPPLLGTVGSVTIGYASLGVGALALAGIVRHGSGALGRAGAIGGVAAGAAALAAGGVAGWKLGQAPAFSAT